MSGVYYTSARQGGMGGLFRDLARGRYLMRDLVWKELRARYRNAMMGFLWAVLQPVLMMAILTFVFGFIFKGRIQELGVGTEHPYPVFLLCGLVPWQFMCIALSSGVHSLIESQELIKKVCFPRELIPLAAIANCLVNLAIGFVTLIVVRLILEGIGSLGTGLLWVPLIFTIQLALIVGVTLALSSLNIYFRDVGYMIEVALTFGFYATPIFYPLSKVAAVTQGQGWLYHAYMFNPMAGIVLAYRQALLGNHAPDFALLAWPACAAATALILGAAIFRRNAPTFADYL